MCVYIYIHIYIYIYEYVEHFGELVRLIRPPNRDSVSGPMRARPGTGCGSGLGKGQCIVLNGLEVAPGVPGCNLIHLVVI